MDSFRHFMENEEPLRDFILKAAQGVCDSGHSMNCRLFVQLTSQDPDIDEYPEVERENLRIGDVLVWGKQDGNYFQWGHYAIWLGNNEILEVPGWNKEMRVSKIMFPKTLSIVGYGKPAKIVRPRWNV
jgi:hypothetical protein